MPPPPTLMMQPAEAVKAVTDSVEAACRLIILDDPEPSLAQHEERRVRLDELGRQFAAGLAHLDAAGAAAEAAAGPKTETQVQEEMAALRRELAEGVARRGIHLCSGARRGGHQAGLCHGTGGRGHG
jgi:hypothetical protein